MKQLAIKRLAFLGILLSSIFFSYVYAMDTTSDVFQNQSSTALGSNNSLISTQFYPRPSGSGAYYINKGNNSSIIGNYFEGYYYDSVLGYFELDWSVNPSENVRIIGSTSLCPNGYGYKLGGYAFSPNVGYMDFDYNENTFVYYCEEDSSLRGYAYSNFSGFQNFTGITFDIGTASNIVATPPSGNEDFLNPGTEINSNSVVGDTSNNIPQNPNQSQKVNSNFTRNTIQNDKFEFDVRSESSFFIIK